MTTEQNLALSNPPEPEVTETTPVVTPETPVVGGPTSQETPVVDDVITIKRSELDAEIRRLSREDKDFAQVYNRDIGNKAAARYRPEIDRLTRQNEALTTAQLRAEYERLTPEQVNERFTKDPQFAASYASVIHAPAPTQQPQDDGSVARARIETIMRMGLNGGLTEKDIQDIQKGLGEGVYDKDITGQQVTIEEGLELLQNDVITRMRRPATSTPVTPVVTPPVAPTVTQRRDTASPDMSNPTGNLTNREQYTMQQIREMPHEAQFALIDRLGGMEKAMADKTIIVEGLNT